jgi:hypothetical protein
MWPTLPNRNSLIKALADALHFKLVCTAAAKANLTPSEV